ncbi:MAG TPA: hypothetical protein VG937_27790 [Polyangiaceae bacterium]|nr:hypothetical protein [Polyangiaceae bacterium]
MRILAALVLGYYLVVGRVGAEIGSGSAGVTALPTGMTAAARSELDRAVGVSLEETSANAPASQSVRRVTHGGRVIFIPDGCSSVQKPFDLVVHFHGAPTSLEPTFEKSGIGGVLAIVNLGIGSGAYEDAFQAPSAFPQFVDRVAQVVGEMCPGASSNVARIALTGWSAGYGAVWRIIDRQSAANRVDAVLLADGMHAGFEPDKKRERVVNAAAMAPFTLFADRAVSGEKLFAITHSSIVTPYASTTETSSFLLQQENINRVPENVQGPRPNMTLLSRGDAGNFHVQGYAGNDKPDHCDQLHAMGETLFPYLRERWAR